ncbi:MAG: MBL fold metallo-hydrolase, partial [Chloroflexota bacterium]
MTMIEANLTQISDHVYWMPPFDPYYPSLCAVVGEQQTLMLDAGKDAAHAQRFLDALKAKGLPSPTYIALTHWHFDHIMGASVIGVPVIAHTLTAEKIAALARYDVNDPGHAEQKAAGNHVANTAEYIQDQLADPHGARIVEPSLIVHDRFEIRLGGGVTCQIQHVGGDHAGDSCAIYIEPDRVLFLGDCLYGGFIPASHNTVKHTFPLLDAVCAFDATQYIQ